MFRKTFTTIAAATVIAAISATSGQAAGSFGAHLTDVAATNQNIEQVGFFKKGGRFTKRGIATIGITSAIAGGIIAHEVSKNRRHRQHAHDRAVDRHIAYCEGKYASYDWESNTFITHSGRIKECRSPYL